MLTQYRLQALQQTHQVFASEGASVSDALVARIANMVSPPPQVVSLVESRTTRATHTQPLAEALSSSDSLAAKLRVYSSHNVAVSLSEQLVSRTSVISAVTDSVALLDAISAHIAAKVNTQESPLWSGTSTSGNTVLLQTTVAMLDALVTRTTARSTVSERVRLNESREIKRRSQATPSETILLTDATVGKLKGRATVNETLSLSEQRSVRKDSYAYPQEVVNFAENLRARAGVVYDLAEVLTLSDLIGHKFKTQARVAEQARLLEVVNGRTSAQIVVNDSVPLGDSTYARKVVKVALTVSMGIGNGSFTRTTLHSSFDIVTPFIEAINFSSDIIREAGKSLPLGEVKAGNTMRILLHIGRHSEPVESTSVRNTYARVRNRRQPVGSSSISSFDGYLIDNNRSARTLTFYIKDNITDEPRQITVSYADVKMARVFVSGRLVPVRIR